jgi:DNA-directed RNA polymerase specialized sigma24 family protein
VTADNRVLHQLRGVAAKLTSDLELRKDLMQEMFLQLLRVQNEQPGRTLSWYIKNCEFHARNYLRLGRSVDSHKRAKNCVPLGRLQHEDRSQLASSVEAIDPVDAEGEMITRDLVDRILPRLTETQQQTLFFLMRGFGVRETARELGVTHPAVIKHRKKIARIASELLGETNSSGAPNGGNGTHGSH